jgi:uncharacterized delta-60 repeat protein
LSFDASLADGLSGNAAVLQAYLSNTILPLSANLDVNIPNPGNLLSFPSATRNTNGWDTITFTFTTTTGGEQFLYLGMLNNSTVVPNTLAPNIPGCFDLIATDMGQRGYYIDNVALIPINEASLKLPTAICTTQKLRDLKVYLSNVEENGTFSGPGVTLSNGIYSFDPSAVGANFITIGYTFINANGCVTTLYDTINVTPTTANPSVGDAINDNFTVTPIISNTGGITASVYTNDKYNGLPSTPESLTEVSFALVTPLSIPGATINTAGAITIPPDTPSGTYTLTYSLSILGNCNTTDTATVTILVSTANESTLPNSVRANAAVYHIATQNTGKLIIGGYFSAYNNISKHNIARLNTDLTLDQTFTYSGNNQGGNGLAIQPSDNKIVVVSSTPMFAGTSSCVTRLLQDGGIDSGFNVGGTGTAGLSGRSNNTGYAVALQSDGKILVGGDFYYYNGQQRFGIARLLPTGALDPSFVPTELNAYYWSVVQYILIQPDGRILLLGRFSIPSGSTNVIKNILRLNANGTLDSSFLAGNTDGSVYYENMNISIFGPLTRMILQPDGKIVVVGGFTKYNGINVNSIVRLGSNGQIDPTFNVTYGTDRGINDVLMEPGTMKIIIGGEFNTFNGQPVKKMIRLNPNGTLDPTFSIGEGTTDLPGAGNCSLCSNYIKVFKRQTDGKIIVGGDFITFNGLSAGNITRISGDAGFQSKSSITTYLSEPEVDINQIFSNIKVYPNPGKELFNIDLSQEEEPYFSISIYNALGERVYSASLVPKQNNVINLSHLPEGYYMAKLENSMHSTTIKLIKY